MELRYERVDTPNTHGAGCTVAAAIAAELAKQVHRAVEQLVGHKTRWRVRECRVLARALLWRDRQPRAELRVRVELVPT